MPCTTLRNSTPPPATDKMWWNRIPSYFLFPPSPLTAFFSLGAGARAGPSPLLQKAVPHCFAPSACPNPLPLVFHLPFHSFLSIYSHHPLFLDHFEPPSCHYSLPLSHSHSSTLSFPSGVSVLCSFFFFFIFKNYIKLQGPLINTHHLSLHYISHSSPCQQ